MVSIVQNGITDVAILEFHGELTTYTHKLLTALPLVWVKYGPKICTYNYTEYFHKHSVKLTEKIRQKHR